MVVIIWILVILGCLSFARFGNCFTLESVTVGGCKGSAPEAVEQHQMLMEPGHVNSGNTCGL